MQRCAPTCGVVELEVFGFLLFMLYINDIRKVARHATPLPSADEIKIV